MKKIVSNPNLVDYTEKYLHSPQASIALVENNWLLIFKIPPAFSWKKAPHKKKWFLAGEWMAFLVG